MVSVAIVSRGKVSIAMVSIATVSGAIVSVVVVGVEAATLLREHHVVIVPVADAYDEGGHAVARQGEEEGFNRLAAWAASPGQQDVPGVARPHSQSFERGGR